MAEGGFCLCLRWKCSRQRRRSFVGGFRVREYCLCRVVGEGNS